MKTERSAAWLILIGAALITPRNPASASPKECSSHISGVTSRFVIGEKYSIVRQRLVQNGNLPQTRRNNSESCSAPEPLCSRFPELIGCAADVPSCLSAWRAKDGTLFTVQINEDPDNPVVEAISCN